MNFKKMMFLAFFVAVLNNSVVMPVFGDYFKMSKRPSEILLGLRQACNKENMKYAGNVVASRLYQAVWSTKLKKTATLAGISLAGMSYLAWRALPQSVSLSTEDEGMNRFLFFIDAQGQKKDNNQNSSKLARNIKLKQNQEKTILCHGNAMGSNSIINFLEQVDPNYVNSTDMVEPNHTGNGFFGPLMNFFSNIEEKGWGAVKESFSLKGAFWWVFSLRTLGFGRERDACGIIKNIKEAVDKKKQIINGVGVSWGGATWTTALHMLAFPEQYDLSWWKALGLTKENNELDGDKIARLKQAVQKGTIVLTAPWLDDAYPLS